MIDRHDYRLITHDEYYDYIILLEKIINYFTCGNLDWRKVQNITKLNKEDSKILASYCNNVNNRKDAV